MNLADILSMTLFLYVGIGVGFGVGFVLFGMHVVDPATRGASWGFRLLMFPASVAMWPVLWWKWAGRVMGRSKRRPSNRP
jgi:hypothetical protein